MTSTRVGGERRERRPWWQWALGILVGLLILVAILGEDESDEERTAATVTQTESAANRAAPPEEEPVGTTGATGAPLETIQDARDLVDDDDYPEALVVAAALGEAAERDIGRRISNRVGRRVSAAVRRGNRGGARRLLASSVDYPTTRALTSARAALRSSERQARARRAAARATRRQERAAALEARRQSRAAAAERERQAEEARAAEEAAPEDSGDSVGEGTCDEVGVKDFPVGPGDERDADGDGIACES